MTSDVKIGNAVIGAPSMGVSEPSSPTRGKWCVVCGESNEEVMTRCKNDPQSREYSSRVFKNEQCEWVPVEGGA